METGLEWQDFCLEGLSNGVKHEAFALFGTRAVFLLQYFLARMKYQAKVLKNSISILQGCINS